MSKAGAEVFLKRKSRRTTVRLIDLKPSYIDALQLSGFEWKCPFKYKCSLHKGDIFCNVCYRVLISRLEDLGFLNHRHTRRGNR